MPEADVLYSDVRFTRAREKGSETTSLPPDTTYSEVKLSKTQPPTEPRGSQQPAVPNERSKVTLERVALVLLSLLLAAAVIALGVTIHENAQTMKDLQKLKENLTERIRQTQTQTKPCTTVQPVCPKHPGRNK
ncbi:C-type lectin domain family 4 member E-like isoform X1 [Lates japonicus]|uniref:C-type lectin domain family 4 member E-like isoform X1 n=1 Tax=Lates japonicus TaxID=270547 RepID=A0AAD3MT64_LATJO|nr:C-type lectin domain family 4 member E-like isoform X1 [Lates japonicus]